MFFLEQEESYLWPSEIFFAATVHVAILFHILENPKFQTGNLNLCQLKVCELKTCVN